jgi:MoaA/NifB/PqqE/SkfB family radical SAM enzyme
MRWITSLPFVTIKNRLTQLRELGTFEIVYTVGEIFSRKDIIKLTREMHFELILFTNLTLLNEEIVNSLKALYISLISTTVFPLKKKFMMEFGT